jgi:hypothetical protein
LNRCRYGLFVLSWGRRIAVAVVVVAVVGVGLLTYFVTAPTTQRAAPAQVVVLLGPPYRPGMLTTAERIDRLSPQAMVLISTPGGIGCRQRFAHQLCFEPDPLTTEGEARYGTTWAHDHGATSITVVAPTYQAARARVWFGRCWSQHLSVVAASTSIGARIRQIPYQGAGFVKAEIFERRC